MGGGPSVDFPQPSQEERDLQRKQLQLLDQQSAEINAFKPILTQQYGLKPTYGDNPQATALLKKIQDSTAAHGGDANNAETMGYRKQFTDQGFDVGENWRGNYITGYEKTPEQKTIDDQNLKLQTAQGDVSLLQAQRLKAALEGTLPVSQGSIQRKTEQFAQLKEQAARAGNPIFGDDPESAFSHSTAGTQMLKSFTDQWRSAEDAERRGDIQTGFGNLGTSAQTSGMEQSVLRSGVPDLGTGKALPGYVSALQPYQFDRQGQFQANQANAQNSAQRFAGIMSLAGQAGGSAAGLYALSSEDSKKDIKPVNDKGDARALSSLRSTKMHTFSYKDEGDTPSHHGPIAERSPKEIITPDGRHVDVMNYIGLLHSSVRALDKEVTRLKARKKEAVNA